ncbi:hypothetical protein DTL70_30870 [Streptomyces diacarni]|uniref:Uncharacterized protein n=1 Tax=Streptomyces diacarni TaxID=2800381 RepID=A0A367EB46_9ACTN|nr:hypothetical protein DTL70_30870 [Streptomyces diacarni]
MTRGPLSVQPGRCAYCDADNTETVQVAVIERGSGPPHGLRMCLPHASQYATTRYAAPDLADQVARLWRAREENPR